jgi:hypothetical protein
MSTHRSLLVIQDAMGTLQQNAFERPVRLPAATRGAKLAGAGRD